jgi:hypothetical protein
MNHPTQNEWLAYLDGAIAPDHAKRLLEHLDQCSACAAELASWRRTAHALQSMSFPKASKVQPAWRHAFPSHIVKWGLAAAIVLFAGIVFDRLSVWRAGALERDLAVQVRQELRSELRADLLAALDPGRQVTDVFQKQLRGELEHALTRAAAQNARFNGDAMQALERGRQEDQQRLVALIQNVRDEQISYCLSLRKDLETAVSTADSHLRQDSRRISELADTLSTPIKQ